eukprot:210263-Rhodomonas_salina.1
MRTRLRTRWAARVQCRATETAYLNNGHLHLTSWIEGETVHTVGERGLSGGCMEVGVHGMKGWREGLRLVAKAGAKKNAGEQETATIHVPPDHTRWSVCLSLLPRPSLVLQGRL